LPTLGVAPLSLYTQSKLPSSGSAFLAPMVTAPRDVRRQTSASGRGETRECAIDEALAPLARIRGFANANGASGGGVNASGGRRRRETTALRQRTRRGGRARVVLSTRRKGPET
jgi:hypothetical protein